MNTPEPTPVAVLDALGTGLPILLLHLAATIVLLVIGVLVYMAVTPFKERALLVHGNPAAGVVLGGAVLALAMPLAVLLATSFTLLDIVVWGVVALVLQLLTLAAIALVLRDLRGMIERGNLAAAVALAATQIAVALLNAAAMVPS
jgi:putative membrane protein